MLLLLLLFWSIEQKKHVVFGSETEEGENPDYETNNVTEVVVNDKEDEFKKVFIVKQCH